MTAIFGNAADVYTVISGAKIDAFTTPDSMAGSSCPQSCWCGCIYCSHMYFEDVSSNETGGAIYHLGTVWGIHYFDQLDHALAGAGFKMLDWESDAVPWCGWQRTLKVYDAGIYRGWLDIRTGDHQNISSQDSARISAVLTAQYPFVEIMILLVVLVFPVILIIFIYWWSYHSKKHGLDRRHRIVRGSSATREKPKEKKQVTTKISKSQRSQWSLYLQQLGCGYRKEQSASLLMLPNELQLIIVSFLDFHDVRRLGMTCNFYNYLVSGSTLQERRDLHKSVLREEEQQISTSDQRVCWSCEHIRQKEWFRDGQLPGHEGNRSCIVCQRKWGEFNHGQRFMVGGGTACMVLCPRCDRLSNAESFSADDDGNLCGTCDDSVKYVDDWYFKFRVWQVIFGIVLFALACSGNFAFHVWAWSVTVTMSILAIFGSLTLMFVESRWSRTPGVPRWCCYAQGVVAALWLATSIAVTCEGIISHRPGNIRFDSRAVGVTTLNWTEFIFSLSAGLLSSNRVIDFVYRFHLNMKPTSDSQNATGGNF
ncbi:hypothetical protein NA57DRAFT_56326 [Rhizodiscina lignyota]|uniref:F-box domain-containing protein n=1 Tax=Rhizodiscina lignyota TaxID=1504668 RepID=A0A9P4MAE4_9PEZI|nr:hypothetical protein NA57DRAFT_56326 [Rhizodiscina lignyota]